MLEIYKPNKVGRYFVVETGATGVAGSRTIVAEGSGTAWSKI